MGSAGEAMKVLITGADGFVGQHVVAAVKAAKHEVLTLPHSLVDLTDPLATLTRVDQARPEIVVHLAAVVGGIGANERQPATFWRDNLQMGLNILEACRLVGIGRLIMAGTTCSYPNRPPTSPFIEEHLFMGYPEETNAPYGIAKLALLEGAKAYRRQYGLKTTYLLPTNMYGPGDNFDLETSHVIPAMIRRMHEARRDDAPCVTLWGDGTPTRDFLYVEDAAQAFALSVDAPPMDEPMNLGSGQELPMSTLAEMVRKVVGYQGEIEWDLRRPNGQPRRCLDSSRAYRKLRWTAETRIVDGLKKTYDWFRGLE